MILGPMIWALIFFLTYKGFHLIFTGFRDTPEFQSEQARPVNPQDWQIKAWETRWQRSWDSRPDYSIWWIASIVCITNGIGAIITLLIG